MTKNFRCKRYFIARIALALLFSAVVYRASAQVIFPGLQAGNHISAFGTITDVKPDYQYYGDYAVVGVTAGGFLQTSRRIGAEVRGSITRWDGLEHEETVLVGPHASLAVANFSPYVCILGGGANAWRFQTPRYPGQPQPKLIEQFGPQWSLVGGLDIHLSYRFVVRVGELSYSKTYLKNWNMTPLSASAGVVYRLK